MQQESGLITHRTSIDLSESRILVVQDLTFGILVVQDFEREHSGMQVDWWVGNWSMCFHFSSNELPNNRQVRYLKIESSRIGRNSQTAGPLEEFSSQKDFHDLDFSFYDPNLDRNESCRTAVGLLPSLNLPIENLEVNLMSSSRQ
ncbi:hypothetical protein M513_08334 [Trichuris suis]|uniref:Uncharacterized protein n=1 Tax=Trichuris suis TaxID=68888 RepID=A0A085M0P7_9BILA|nr:hypothetical protein M513_08334 [Trichuris suis]